MELDNIAPTDLKGNNTPSQNSLGSDLSTIEVKSPEQEKESSGANISLLAPAGSVMAEPSQTVCTSNVAVEVPQCGTDDPMDQEATTGLLSKGETIVSPLQEHSPSEGKLSTLRKSFDLKTCLQISELNNSPIFKDILSLFSQKSSENSPDSNVSIPQQDIDKEKMLYSKIDSFQPIEPSKALKECSYDPVSAGAAGAIPKNTTNPYSIPTRHVIQEETKKMATYSKVLMPPNVVASTTGSAPECGIVVEWINGVSLESYAWAASEVTGKSSIAFIGRDPRDQDYVLVFLKTADMAENLVHKGIWIRGKWLNVSFFQQPASRLTVSSVLPFVPDSLIISACEPFGSSVYPVLRKIPASVRSQVFKGAYSYRREIYLVKKTKETVIPDSITVSFLGTSYELELTTQGPKCFACGSVKHTQRNCDNLMLQPEASVTTDDPQNPSKEKTDLHHKHNAQPVIHQCNTTQKETQQKTTRAFFTQCNVAGLPPFNNKDKIIISNGMTESFMEQVKSPTAPQKIIPNSTSPSITVKNKSSSNSRIKLNQITTAKVGIPVLATITNAVNEDTDEVISSKKSRKFMQCSGGDMSSPEDLGSLNKEVAMEQEPTKSSFTGDVQINAMHPLQELQSGPVAIDDKIKVGHKKTSEMGFSLPEQENQKKKYPSNSRQT